MTWLGLFREIKILVSHCDICNNPYTDGTRRHRLSIRHARAYRQYSKVCIRFMSNRVSYS